MSDDWLEPTPPQQLVPFEGTAASAAPPGIEDKALLAASDAAEARAQFLASWETLTDGQRVFLNTWRECRFNARRTYAVLAGTSHTVSKGTVNKWAESPAFAFVRDRLRGASMTEILSRDYLAARHEDIVETLLTPKPILHQGFSTGHFEVEAAAAGKANETLLKLGGHLKEKDVELNVGIVGPSFVIQVVQADSTVRDITPRGVTIDLPAPAEDDGGWLDGA